MKIKELFKNYKNYNLKISKPYFIAEAGVNHEGDMDIAKRLIDEAKMGGADAIKFQTYKAETFASKKSPHIGISPKNQQNLNMNFKKHDKF